MKQITNPFPRLKDPSAIFPISGIQDYLQWLATTPTITSIRVNLLRTSTLIFEEKLKKYLKEQKSIDNPQEYVFKVPELPEVIFLRNRIANISSEQMNDRKSIIVDVHCGAAVLRGAHIFAPGVLGMETGSQIGESVNIFADIEGACKQGTNIHYESKKKFYLGNGIIEQQRYKIFNKDKNSVGGIAVRVTNTVSGIISLDEFIGKSSYTLLQNLPSIICGHVLNPQPGEKVLDMCAAPGNKTSHLAELMNDHGLIIAIDKIPRKIEALKLKIHDHGYKSVHCFSYDSAKLYAPEGHTVNDTLIDPPYCDEQFDKILLDGPCSALGNRPQLNNPITDSMLLSYPKMQKKLLTAAVPLLKSKGTLVYSTCTVNVNENERMVEWVLNKFQQLELVEAIPHLGGYGWTDCGINDTDCYKVQRFGLSNENTNSDLYSDTIGFFIAKFRKK